MTALDAGFVLVIAGLLATYLPGYLRRRAAAKADETQREIDRAAYRARLNINADLSSRGKAVR